MSLTRVARQSAWNSLKTWQNTCRITRAWQSPPANPAQSQPTTREPSPNSGGGSFVFPRFPPPSLLVAQTPSTRIFWDTQQSRIGSDTAGLLGSFGIWFWENRFLVSGKKKSTTRIWAVDKVVNKVIHRLWISVWKSPSCLWIPVQHLSTGDSRPLWIKPNSREVTPRRTRSIREPRSTNYIR